MKIALQLIKEFWLPFLLALVWTAYNFPALWTDEAVSVKDVVNVFGPSFFFICWMTGQFFRVKKQKTVEHGLTTIDDRVGQLVNDFDATTKRIVNQLTGGDSYCRLMIEATELKSDRLRFMAAHEGEYPLYDLQVRIVDLEKFESLRTLLPGPIIVMLTLSSTWALLIHNR